MRQSRSILTVIFLFLSLAVLTAGEHDNHESTHDTKEGGVNVKEIIFGHIGDSYEWHITDIGHTHVTIPLPVIIYSRTSGWHVFMSSKISHGLTHNGFYVSHSEANEGKIVEKNSAGEEVRPIDISITKNVTGIFINSLLMVAIILGIARTYRKRTPESSAPGGFAGFFEMLIMMIHDDVIKACVGPKYSKFSPYLLTAFFFILINNIMGLIPIFPGGANITGNIAVTMVLALFTFVIVNISGSKHYWKEIFWPEVPWWLKAPLPIMPFIEFLGIFTKPFALMIRLFANILAGHMAILVLVCLVFISASMAPVITGSLTVASVLFNIFMNMLEILVAFIQAYVFTMLSAVFIGLAVDTGHHAKEEGATH